MMHANRYWPLDFNQGLEPGESVQPLPQSRSEVSSAQTPSICIYPSSYPKTNPISCWDTWKYPKSSPYSAASNKYSFPHAFSWSHGSTPTKM